MADETKKSGPTKQWDNPKLLTELCVALYQALEASGGLTSQMKDAIPAYLEAQEHPMTWSAIRYKPWDVHQGLLIFSYEHGCQVKAALDRQKKMASRRTMTWDAQVHEDILIEVFQTVTLSPVDVGKLMGGLKAKGYTFSESALR